jgi:hypothetical protein
LRIIEALHDTSHENTDHGRVFLAHRHAGVNARRSRMRRMSQEDIDEVAEAI